MPGTLLIRTEASRRPNVGTGHLWREIYLARALQAKGARVFFAVSGDHAAEPLLRSQRFAYHAVASHGVKIAQWKEIVARIQPDMVVFDRWHVDTREMRHARDAGSIVVLMDGVGSAGRWADIRINGLRQDGLSQYEGTKYVVIPPTRLARRNIPRKARSLVCSFGGQDHNLLMHRVWNALAKENPFERVWCFCDTVLKDQPATKVAQRKLGPGVQLYFGDPRLPGCMAKADMGLVSGGLTLYQALSNGLPSVVIGQYPHQSQRAKELARKGVLVHLGISRSMNGAGLLPLLKRLQCDRSWRKKLGERARRCVDGKGLSRVTKILWESLQKRKRLRAPKKK